MEKKQRRIPLPLLVLLQAFLLTGAASAQAPSAIQVFLPNGDRPTRELRLILTRDDGRYEIQFTDSKGKFQLTGDLNRDREYSITIEGDRRSYETTTASIRILRGSTTYLPIFLRPLKTDQRRPGVLEISNSESHVPKGAREKYERALLAMQNGKAGEALQLLQAAVKAYPTYLRALNDLGVLHLQLNQLEEAAATLRRAIKVNDSYEFARLNLAIVLNRQGKFPEALELLRKLQQDRVELPGLHPALAESLIGTNDLKGAKEILHTITADRARDQAGLVEAHYKLGLLLSRGENYADAVVHLQQAVSLDPQAANAHLLLGGALLQLQRKAEAELALLRAYSLGKQEMGNAQLLLGQLYTSEQKYELARDAFTQYLKDCPNAANAAQVRTAIDKIQQAIATGKPEAPPK